jgi:monoamine oxidase
MQSKTDYASEPATTNDGFTAGPTGAAWRKVSAGTLLDMALDPIRRYYLGPDLDFSPSSPADVEKLVQGWARVLYDFDEYSMQRFLEEEALLTQEQIDAIGTLENLSSRLPLSFIHSVLGRADINPNVQFWELNGGSRKLPYAMFDDLVSRGGKGAPRRLHHGYLLDPGRG